MVVRDPFNLILNWTAYSLGVMYRVNQRKMAPFTSTKSRNLVKNEIMNASKNKRTARLKIIILERITLL